MSLHTLIARRSATTMHQTSSICTARFMTRSMQRASAAAPRSFSSSSSSSSSSARPLNLAIMGAPGSGKGTFATRLAPILRIPTISTGDLIRAEIKSGSNVGQEVKALTERGGLVSDEIVLDLLSKRLDQPDAKSGFILDGYPRRISQADTLSTLHPITLSINLLLDEGVLVEKALARRICSNCGTGYNLANIQRDGYEMPPLLPKKEGCCDKCGGHLITRADDTEPIIRERLRVYTEETYPIIEYYKKKNVLMEFKIRKGVADLPDLVKAIEQRIQKQ